MKNKSSISFWVDGIIFILSVIALIIVIPMSGKLDPCPDPTRTSFALFVSVYCNFGFLGIFFLIVAIISFVEGIRLLSKNSKR